jgi:hypothetical protein
MAIKDVSEMSLQEIRDAAEAAELAAAEPEAETIYTRTVAGKVYSAPSLEELMDVVANVAAEARAAIPAPAPVEDKPLTPDEEFILAQEFASSPSKSFEKMLQRTTGMSAKDFKQKVQSARETEANMAAETFVAQTPEYNAIPANGTRLQESMRAQNLECTVENIRKTYEDLKSKGLMVEKPEPVDPYSIPLESLRNLAMGNTDTELDF